MWRYVGVFQGFDWWIRNHQIPSARHTGRTAASTSPHLDQKIPGKLDNGKNIEVEIILFVELHQWQCSDNLSCPLYFVLLHVVSARDWDEDFTY